MNTVEKINSIKAEFKTKYEYGKKIEIFGDGSFEKVCSIPKSELTEFAKEQMDEMQKIYWDVVRFIESKNYEITGDCVKEKSDKLEGVHTSNSTDRFLNSFIRPEKDLGSFVKYLSSTYFKYEGLYKGNAKGDYGEEYVEKELEVFQGKYKYLKNIKLDHEDIKGKTSETDLYVITSKGILVCEIKNKGNERVQFKISSDGQWTKYDTKGKFIEVMDSPFSQNTRHCIATEKLLKQNGIDDFKIIPVVIIANEKVLLDNQSKNAVIRISELYNLIENMDLPEKYDEEYQTKVIGLLTENNIVKENDFETYAIDENMDQKSVAYAEYLLQMLEDKQMLIKEISNLEKELLAEKKKSVQKKCLKPAGIGLIIELLLFVVMMFTKFYIMWVVIIFGALLLYFYITNDYLINIDDEMKMWAREIIVEGKYKDH